MQASAWWRVGVRCGAGACALGLSLAGWTGCGGDSFTQDSASGGNASAGAGGTAAAGNGGSGGSAASAGSGATGGGGGAAYTACTGPGQCTLVPTNCCGTCETDPPLSDFLAINAGLQQQYLEETCAGVGCPSCYSPLPGHYAAVCRKGECVALDIREDPDFTSCDQPSDCTLRWGSSCCESCTPELSNLVAVRVGKVERNQCGQASCPDCATPEYPHAARAVCDNRVCRLVYVD